MKASSSVVILAAALGVSAHPSGHAHQRAHAKRDFVVANKPVTVVEYATQVVTADAAPATAVPEAPASPKVDADTVPKAAASGPAPAASAPAKSNKNKGKKHNSSSGSGYKPFCGGKKAKRATLEDIAAKGNTGVPGDFGCNMMTVDEDVADKYDYTTTFKNDHDEDKECVCFNKIGPNGLIDGFFAKNVALTFTVPASSSQVVAFDTDSQGGCACASNKVPTTSDGQWASTWLEFDFGSERNNNWSGADASCLVSAAKNLNIPGLRVCDSENTCSIIYPGGTGKNAYLAGMEAEDGIGINTPLKQVRLTVDIDYSA
ncbi:Allergen Asp f 4 [Fusarium oxysporum f. sp. cubense]|uniref:Allergen Asp f 4 n=1 Tax=Fusarium oxysporum f. sp. cubense TaxID=61366 RepID=A0A559KYI0_FUSOC|nr:Allergen Asp f 4 [Fusarium oxysporum f. sp. cubense]